MAATNLAPAKTAPKAPPLPRWDLRDLYPAMDSPLIERDLKLAAKAAAAFEKRYRGRLAKMSGDALALAIAAYEKMQDRIGRLQAYAGLVFAGDMSDPRIGQFHQTVQERVTALTTHLLFFTLELNRLPEAALKTKLKSKKLARYKPWLRDIRVFRPYQLEQSLEELLHEKMVSGRNAWIRLFEETIAGLRFPMDGKQLTMPETMHLFADKDSAVRKKAGQSLGGVFAQNVRLFALITNTLAKDKEIEDRWRRMPNSESRRHLENQVEPEVVEALVSAVQGAFPALSHRYYKIKARWLGGPQLDWWDRGAPLPEEDDRYVPWAEARDTVLDSYRRFSPKLAAIGQTFFTRNWIDVGPRPGKSPGAFAHPTVPSAHPYVLLNYQGKTRDVMTLAHELGHGVHQVLAAKQGALMADTPLTLAETASVFGEQLTFRALLNSAKPAERRAMLAQKVEDMLNTVVRQIAFFLFERRLHTERKAGELTAERIGEIWMDIQRESLGPALRFDDTYRTFWSYIPHFVHTPFYVYAYAFGDCLVNALYARYQEAEKGFEGRYLAMLQAGGTLRHKELLAPFGLDASDPGFWAQGLGVIGRFIDELETA